MLKIIWYSTVPYSSVGYGNATREILRRFRDAGHQVRLATKHALGGSVVVDGIDCFDGGERDLINIIRKEEGYDYIISMCDDWCLPPPFKFDNWINCCFLDAHMMHPRLLEASKRSLHTIAMTKFTRRELETNGRPCFYAPLGVNTSTFKPDPQRRKEFREGRFWTDETFVIGSLGLNYSSDRKNFIGLLQAFKIFHEKHPDSLLYLHTDVMGTASHGLPLQWIINNLGFKEDGTGAVQYVVQKPYHLWEISEETIIRTFNAFDVFCFPTMGEGFGMPIIEAQSCGVPVIVPDTTSCKELLKGGWLIECEPSDMEFSVHLAWIMRTRVTKIVEKLEEAYTEWKSGKIKERGIQAREGSLEYDWDTIYKEHWTPIFDYLDAEKVGKIFDFPKKYPDYQMLYNGFGQLYQIGNCENYEHDKVCFTMNMPRLPNEPEDETRPLLIRSYPIFPDSSGEFYVHTKCPVSKFMPPRFVKHCASVWKEVLSYPIIRQEVQKLWEEKVKDNSEYAKLSDIIPAFDEGYSKFLQTFFQTTFKIGPIISAFLQDCSSFVDVGCGDGRVLKQIKELKPDAIIKGTEINNYWINGEEVVYGDMLKLPFKDEEFDCVFSIDVLEHTSEPLKALDELFRIAKKKLILCVTPVNDLCFEEDPTHVVKWDLEQWKREINVFGNIQAIGPDNTACTFIVEKRGG